MAHDTQIVTEESASIQGFTALVIRGDHIEMCKFTSAKDDRYILVLGVLQDWANKCHGSKGSEEPGFVSSSAIKSVELLLTCI